MEWWEWGKRKKKEKWKKSEQIYPVLTNLKGSWKQDVYLITNQENSFKSNWLMCTKCYTNAQIMRTNNLY